MAHTFPVADVASSAERLPRIPVVQALREASTPVRHGWGPDGPTEQRPDLPPLEACSDVPGGVVAPGAHPLVTAVQHAFDGHHPLVLSPDHLWLTLAQGFALHVRQHADALRERFVAHSGRLTLSVRRDDFWPGRRDNPWPQVFDAFSQQIREHIGKRHDLVACDFSTTGPLERAVSDLVLMDTVERWFEYDFVSLCGIPSVTLLGTPDDWRSIQRRARVFGDFGLEAWARALDPVLGALVDAAEGRVDPDHWRSLYKRLQGSGGPFITGWIQVLFPYLLDGKTLRPNPHMGDWRFPADGAWPVGTRSSDLPCAVNAVPFTWTLPTERLAMIFTGGFIGVHQDSATGAVQPQLGWSVRGV